MATATTGNYTAYTGATLTFIDTNWAVASSNVCAFTTGTTGYSLIHSEEETKAPEKKKLLLLLP